ASSPLSLFGAKERPESATTNALDGSSIDSVFTRDDFRGPHVSANKIDLIVGQLRLGVLCAFGPGVGFPRLDAGLPASVWLRRGEVATAIGHVRHVRRMVAKVEVIGVHTGWNVAFVADHSA